MGAIVVSTIVVCAIVGAIVVGANIVVGTIVVLCNSVKCNSCKHNKCESAIVCASMGKRRCGCSCRTLKKLVMPVEEEGQEKT